MPSWGAGRGGTRFAKFPFPGEPTNIHEKLEDCAVINQLCRATPRVSPHFPWDKVSDYAALREEAAALGLGFDAVNSNTFQDQPGQAHTYATGSLSLDPRHAPQAVAHNIECIEIGRSWARRDTHGLGRRRHQLPRPAGLHPQPRPLSRGRRARSTAALPDDWRMLLEHKMFEPAFYSSVISDWGSSILAAQELGPKAKCLVDLGHHAPNTNIEQIVARLTASASSAGSTSTTASTATTTSIPGRSTRTSCSWSSTSWSRPRRACARWLQPGYMIDQSHNVTDPIESLMVSTMEIQRAYAQALLVDRIALHAHQQANDALMATTALKEAFRTDVEPILAMARHEKAAAIDPVAVFRRSGYRAQVAERRPAVAGGSGGMV